MKAPSARYLARLLALTIVYYAMVRVGVLFATISGAISPMWPPSGVSIAAMLWGGVGLWPAVFVGGLVSNFQLGLPWYAAAVVALGGTLEPLAGVWLTRRLAPGLMQVGRPRDFFLFLFAAALPAAVLGALVGTGTVALFGRMGHGEWTLSFVTWVMGDWMGIVTIAPLILAWSVADMHDLAGRWREATIVVILLVASSVLGFASLGSLPSGQQVRWVLFPVVVWAAVRFGLRGSSLAVLIVASVATWSTVHGHEPFGVYDPLSAAWRLAGFLAVTAGATHAVAFLSSSREMAMRSLEEGNQRLGGVVNTAMDAIITLDPQWRVRFFNRAAERLFQWRAEEVIGRPGVELAPKRSRDGYLRGMAAFQAGGLESVALPHGGRQFALRRDGTEFPVDATISQYEAGGERLFTIIFRDISERLEAERALRESEERFDAILASMGDIAWSVSVSDRRVLYCSAAAEDVYGLSREEIMRDSGSWLETTHPADRELVRASLKRMYEDGVSRVEHRIVRPDGELRWLRVRMSLKRDALGQPVRIDGVSTDITQTRDLEAQLRESQKLEAVGTLAGGIAHDFNNILTAISGNAELAMQDPALAGESREQVAEIQRAARRARDLAQQILVFSRRREAAERRAVDLGEVAREVLRLIRATVPTTVAIEARLPAQPVVVLGDQTQLHQVITNLCTNAWHAMREGGSLAVEVKTVDWSRELSRALPALKPGGYAMLSVHDTGTGMSPAVRARIFEPFFTTKSVGEGSGLGLSVVHGIVVEHGGTIVVESAPGQGARFDVYLPLSDAFVAASLPSEAPADVYAERGGGQWVLLVEDEASVGKVMAQGLGRMGFQTQLVADPREALAAIVAAPRSFDAVITDLTMPGLNGIELARRLQSVRADLPVILYSGDISAVMAAARAAGIREVLEKPVPLAELGAAVRRVLG